MHSASGAPPSRAPSARRWPCARGAGPATQSHPQGEREGDARHRPGQRPFGGQRRLPSRDAQPAHPRTLPASSTPGTNGVCLLTRRSSSRCSSKCASCTDWRTKPHASAPDSTHTSASLLADAAPVLLAETTVVESEWNGLGETRTSTARGVPRAARLAAKDFLQQTRFSGMPPWVLIGGGKTPAAHPATAPTSTRAVVFASSCREGRPTCT